MGMLLNRATASSGTPVPTGPRRGQRLGFLVLALVVLKGVEAAVVVAAAGILALAPVPAAPRLHLRGPLRLELQPETAGAALAVLLVGAAVAAALLRTRRATAHLAGIAGLVTAVSAAAGAATAPGALPARLAVLAVGGVATALTWPAVRRILPGLLVRAGMYRLSGPRGEAVLVAKILIMVALLTWVV